MAACRSFSQLKAAQRDYQDWQKESGIDDIMARESLNVKPLSAQGFDGRQDFPKVEIRVPDDGREMDTSDDW